MPDRSRIMVSMNRLTPERRKQVIAALVGAKQKNVKPEKRNEGWGDVWTWVAIDSDTKLVPSYRVGARDVAEAQAFMDDLAGRLRHRVQLTSDGHHAYLPAVEGAFEGD